MNEKLRANRVELLRQLANRAEGEMLPGRRLHDVGAFVPGDDACYGGFYVTLFCHDVPLSRAFSTHLACYVDDGDTAQTWSLTNGRYDLSGDAARDDLCARQ